MSQAYDKILLALQSADKPLTMLEWAERARKSKPTIWRHHKDMLRNGDIVMLAPRKNEKGNRFRAITGSPVELKAVNNPQDLDPKELLQLLVAWSKQPWDPKAFKSARALPVGLAQLYGYAVEASFGAKISQADLDSVRNNMSEFLTDLQSLIKVVAGLLATHQIWDEKKFVEFLMSNRDPHQIQEFVHRVRELN